MLQSPLVKNEQETFHDFNVILGTTRPFLAHWSIRHQPGSNGPATGKPRRAGRRRKRARTRAGEMLAGVRRLSAVCARAGAARHRNGTAIGEADAAAQSRGVVGLQ